MKSASKDESWTWYRWSAYNIVDDAVEPSPTARLFRYSPWAQYKSWRNEVADALPPYVSLFAVIKATDAELRNLLISGTPPSSAVLKHWCDWFAKHGLLGLLPHQLHQVTYRPIWRQADSSVKKLTPVTVTHCRVGGKWHELQRSLHERDFSGLAAALTKPKPDHPVFEEEALPGKLEMWLDVHNFAPTSEHITHIEGEYAYQFLDEYLLLNPDDALMACPLPLSDTFWKLYREPLLEVFRAALELHDAAVQVIKAENEDAGLEHLNRLMAETTVSIATTSNGQREVTYAYPSLLSAFACMIALDLEGQRRLFLCPECGTVFASHAYQSNYCSARCRNRVNTREFRTRQKAIRLRHEKHSEAEIAKELGATIEQVRDWLMSSAVRKKT